MVTGLERLTACVGARRIAQGKITAEALVRSCLERIEAREPIVRAWTFLDPDAAIRQARACDRTTPAGPLHGVPIGVKDIIDTADMPTEYGSPIYSGHRPGRDATCVARVRAAGAIILGKTVSTEFAYTSPVKTRNPHDPKHTPGGSSSGSAAAVGDFMVPLALGTQTGGSTLRPAAYCGAFAFKPTYGRIDLGGVKPLAPSFDTIGLIARSVDDLALLNAVLGGEPPRRATIARRHRPRIGFCRTPFWKQAEKATRRALADAVTALREAGAVVEDVALPKAVREMGDGHDLIMSVEAPLAFVREYEKHRKRLGRNLRQSIERGFTIPPEEVQRVRRAQMVSAIAVDRMFDRYDALLTPSSPGEAERGDTVGSAVFNRLWTAMHLPCITLPSSRGPNGLPVGVQLVGRSGGDRELLGLARRVARWLIG